MSQPDQAKPDLFFDAITAYQRTAALKAAIDLDLFTHFTDLPRTAADFAQARGAETRGVRILCDYMTVQGFLEKSGDRYTLTPVSAAFLNRKSPAYAGGAAEFLLSDHLLDAFKHLTESVRRGGASQSEQGSLAPEHPMWVTFARAMGGLMYPASQGLADLLALDPARPAKILDIAAGHGIWGISVAAKYPQSKLVALDWAPVLKVAQENAERAGIGSRFSAIAGSAFDAELGTDYDVILIPNFLHHFSAGDCIRFLKRAHAALRPGGRVAIVEFIPNKDRVTPPQAAGFSLVMLATTPEGDAYTLDEYSQMLAESGFQTPTQHPLPASMNQALLATKV